MNLTFHGNLTEAIVSLEAGSSVLVPCGRRTVQSVMSTIASLPGKRGLPSNEFSQRKALLVIDEKVMPMVVVIVTRKRASGSDD